MRKVIAAFNMTLDGYCDHTSGIPADEIHFHYAKQLEEAGVILYGRTTYQLMEYWRSVLENPTGEKHMDDFASAINKVPKLVFSRTLKSVDWASARLSKRGLAEEVNELKQQAGKDIYVSSPSLIVQLTQLGMIDEYQLCIHPVIAGSGLVLFKDIKDKILLKLIGTKVFDFGGVILYYEPEKNNL
ncbi:MAG TPA: dihydrofolate reductase family protein [Ignavibacteria bacterium]|nr:dihydrofolate reductase family protein [Ignavibacteria bacterium]HMQ99473.1 dihydrofolate reductase family protein [Ignavibacteria bacterium]